MSLQYERRVVAEKVDLDEKLVKLTAFINESMTFRSLDGVARSLLMQQHGTMVRYSAILGLRIARFGKE